MAKKATILVRLESSANTGYFYVRRRNPKKLTEKLRVKKYDPHAPHLDDKGNPIVDKKTGKAKRGRHVWFEEKKNKFK